MRILLDECLPRQLGRELVGHVVRTVTTIDRRLPRDHRPPSPLAIVALTAVNNRVETIRALVPEILRALGTIRPGDVARVGR